MKRKLITPFDICLILLVLLFSLFMFFFYGFSGDGRKAVITVNEKIVAELELDLNQTKEIITDNGYNIVVIKNNECFVSNADCRDNICVKHKAIGKVGQSIVCLPHKVIVEIK